MKNFITFSQNQTKEFSVNVEKDEIRKLLHQIFNSFLLTKWGYIKPDSLISIRYFLRKERFTQYCRLIQSVPEGLKRCQESDRKLVNNVIRKKSPCFHYCHAGLVDFAFPVQFSSGLIPIIGGQLLFHPYSEKEKEELLDKIKDLPLERDLLRKALEDVPIIPFKTIKGIVALLMTILEQFPEKESIKIISEISGQKISKYEKIEKIIAFLKAHYKENFSIKELSEKIEISPYYLSHLFKKEMGISVMKYRDYLRIITAKEMLQNTNLTITNIAFSLGWNDSNYFSYIFKKETGLSPSNFRKIHLKSNIL